MDNRFWEIDFLRGLAVIAMIVYHIFFDLNFFNFINLPTETMVWFLAPRLIAGTFIFLVGLSMTISFKRRRKRLSEAQLNFKYLERGLRILIYGLIITLAIWLYFNQTLIVFGILHFIGVSIILAYLVLKADLNEGMNLALAFSLLIAGVLLQTMEFNFYWLLWLGFTPQNFFMLDYFPLLPWFGIILLGIHSGKRLYGHSRRKFDLKEVSNLPINFFAFLGRNSLEIYFLHQPVLIGLIHLLG